MLVDNRQGGRLGYTPRNLRMSAVHQVTIYLQANEIRGLTRDAVFDD